MENRSAPRGWQWGVAGATTAIGIVCVVLLMASCALFEEPLLPDLTFHLEARGVVYETDIALRPTLADQGLTVQLITTMGTTVRWGDNTETEAIVDGLAEHVYPYGGIYNVRVTGASKVVYGSVNVLNERPRFHGVFCTQASEDWGLGWMELVTFDLRDLWRGCSDPGLTRFGIDSVDGDPILVRLTVLGPDKYANTVEYSVYDSDGNRVNGQFVEAELLYPWIGWEGQEPYRPVFPRGPGFGFLSALSKSATHFPAEAEVCPFPDLTVWEGPLLPNHGTIWFQLEILDPWIHIDNAVKVVWIGFLASSPVCAD